MALMDPRRRRFDRASSNGSRRQGFTPRRSFGGWCRAAYKVDIVSGLDVVERVAAQGYKVCDGARLNAPDVGAASPPSSMVTTRKTAAEVRGCIARAKASQAHMFRATPARALCAAACVDPLAFAGARPSAGRASAARAAFSIGGRSLNIETQGSKRSISGLGRDPLPKLPHAAGPTIGPIEEKSC